MVPPRNPPPPLTPVKIPPSPHGPHRVSLTFTLLWTKVPSLGPQAFGPVPPPFSWAQCILVPCALDHLVCPLNPGGQGLPYFLISIFRDYQRCAVSGAHGDTVQLNKHWVNQEMNQEMNQWKTQSVSQTCHCGRCCPKTPPHPLRWAPERPSHILSPPPPSERGSNQHIPKDRHKPSF